MKYKNMLSSYCQAVDRCIRMIGESVAWFMPVLALVVGFEVFARYLFGSPTEWAFDVSLFIASYVAALSGALAQQSFSHINVNILYEKVSACCQSIFNLIIYLIIGFFMSVVLIMAIDRFQEALVYDYRRMSDWAPAMHHFWVMLAVSAGLVLLQLSSHCIKDVYFLLHRQALPVPVKEHGYEY